MLLGPTLLASLAVAVSTEALRAGEIDSGRDNRGGFYAHFVVPGPVAQVYAVLADDAAMHTWIPRLTLSTVRGAGPPSGAPSAVCHLVDFSVPTPIGEVRYQLDRCHDGQKVWWTLAEGEQFEAIEGAYELVALDAGTTLVHYWSRVVGNVPVPEWAQAEAGRIGVSGLVEGLRAEVARRGAL